MQNGRMSSADLGQSSYVPEVGSAGPGRDCADFGIEGNDYGPKARRWNRTVDLFIRCRKNPNGLTVDPAPILLAKPRAGNFCIRSDLAGAELRTVARGNADFPNGKLPSEPNFAQRLQDRQTGIIGLHAVFP